MKYSPRGLLPLLAAFSCAGALQGAPAQKSLLELEYGTYFDADNWAGSLFTSSDKVKFDLDTNLGLLLIGYFNPDYDIEQDAQDWTSANFKQEMLGNFNVLASSSDWANGFLLDAGEIVDFSNPLGEGGEVKAFLMTISGVTDFQAALADDIREFGIFHDSSWGFIPDGDSFFATEYSVKGASYDSVILGTELEGEGLGLGHAYAAQLIPEPSTYALFLGFAALGLVWWRRRGHSPQA